MKILTTKTQRSLIAEELRKKGDFQKVKGKYIQGELEIWFMDASAITEEHIAWADVICGVFYGVPAYKAVEESNKLSKYSLLSLVQMEVHGYEELYQVIIRNSSDVTEMDFDIKCVRVLAYNVQNFLSNRNCFRTEKEAAEFAHERIKYEIEKAEKALKRFKKMRLKWERTLESF